MVIYEKYISEACGFSILDPVVLMPRGTRQVNLSSEIITPIKRAFEDTVTFSISSFS